MRILRARTKSGLEATCHVSHTGIRVFYEINHVSFEKVYDNPNTAALEIKNTLYNAEVEENSMFDNLKKELINFNFEIEE